jgi:hypothetical protein
MCDPELFKKIKDVAMMLLKKMPLVALCFLFSTATAWAALEVRPSLFVEEEYNDNINSSSDNEEEDWITTIQPGIHLDYASRSISAALDYSLEYRFYKENDEDNQNDFKDVQRAVATADFFEGRPFTFHASEIISRETLDETDDNEFSEENRSTVYHLTLIPEYTLRLAPTLSVVFGYEFDRIDYVESEGDDSTEHAGRATLYKDLNASTIINAGYSYSILDADNDEDDFDRQDISAGLDYRVGDRINASLSGGYAEIDYDDGYSEDSSIWAVDLSYRQSGGLLYSAGLSQDFTVSATDGLTETQRATLGATYQRNSFSAGLTTFWEKSDYVRENRDDTTAGITGTLSKPLASNLTATAELTYERGWYDDSGVDEDVNRYTTGVSFDYQYRRFVASLGYRLRLNDSDISGNDYTNNIVSLSGSVQF